MLSLNEFEAIQHASTENKFTKKQLLEFLSENYVIKTSLPKPGRGNDHIRKIKDDGTEYIGVDQQGNPIVDKTREKEKKLGVKIRTESESSRADV